MTASEVFFEAAMERNDVMMPHTVPNRPTKGAVEATVASTMQARLRAARPRGRWTRRAPSRAAHAAP